MIYLLKFDEDFFTTIGVSFLIGLGIQTLFIFLLGLAYIPLSLYSSLLILIIPTFIFFFFRKQLLITKMNSIQNTINTYKIRLRSKQFYLAYLSNPISVMSIILVILIVSLSSLDLIYNLYWPIDGWDALVLYDFRAKYFLISHTIFPTPELDYFLSYPLFTSLSHLFFYQLGAKNVRFIYSLLFIAFIAIIYGQTRRTKPVIIALLTSVFVLSQPILFEHARIAYTNLPFTIFYISGLLFLYNWYTTKKTSSAIISAILVALSCWTRYIEPFWLIPLSLVFSVSFKRKNFFLPFLYLLIILVVKESWIYYIRTIYQQFNKQIIC